MPYKTPVGTTYDSGDFAAVFDEALARADVAGFARAPRTSEAAGKRRGLGVSCFLEIAGGQPGEGAAIVFPGDSRSCCWRSACRRAGRGTARSIAGSSPSGSASRAR